MKPVAVLFELAIWLTKLEEHNQFHTEVNESFSNSPIRRSSQRQFVMTAISKVQG